MKEDVMDKDLSSVKAKGGLARAKVLSKETRVEIARKAAVSRWESHKVTHEGILDLAGTKLACYVTEEGIRVLSGRGMQSALRLVDGELSTDQQSGSRLERLLNTKALNPEIFNDETVKRIAPIKCSYKGKVIHGYQADALAEICDAMLEARLRGLLKTERQMLIVQQCEIFMRCFAKVGITALVDEVTGYQGVRDRQALQAILDMYLAKEFATWAKRFPDEFYWEMFRLKGWQRNPMKVTKPQVIGHCTNNIVYARLAPGILEELKTLNPKDTKGKRKGKHHQLLTDDVGVPALVQHLHAVMGFMRASANWEQFIDLLDRAFPKKDTTLFLPFEE